MGSKPGRRRRLTAEDRAIWERVARTATPLARPSSPSPRPAPPSLEPRRDPAAPAGPPPAHPKILKPEGRPQPAIRADLHDPCPAPVGRPEPGLDKRTAERLRRGDRAPDARIDLHGLTAERAHAKLDAFLREAIRARRRCLLVITGKGGRRPSGEEAPFMAPRGGVLREAAPKWLRTGPHAGRIVGIYEAHQRHGGAGAFYVYLKK